MNSPNVPRSSSRTVLIVLSMLLASALLTAAAAFVALSVMPCEWFGSAFEGGCGYGAVGATFVGAMLLWPALFLAFIWLYFRRGMAAVAEPVPGVQRGEAARLLTQWRLVFALMVVVQLLPLLMSFTVIDFWPPIGQLFWWAGVLLLLANAAMTYRIAAAFRQQPIVMALASVVIGVLGAVGVFIYLHAAIGRAHVATPTAPD